MLRLLVILALSFSALGLVRKEGYKGWAWYEVGRDNLILASGHGGKDMPTELPRRHNGCLENDVCVYKQGCSNPTDKCKIVTVLDSFTIELTNQIAAKLREQDIYPHVVFCNISRQLIDLNRPIDQACMGAAECEKLYDSWHGFIREVIKKNNGKGLFIDVHGQSHKANWTELGYRIKKSALNDDSYSKKQVRSSIHQLQSRSGLSLKELITGQTSMGHFLSEEGYRVVPSGKIQKPGTEGYYRGGYNTDIYGSARDNVGHCMDAIQFEVPKNLRFKGKEGLKKVGADFALAIRQFYEFHNYGHESLVCASSEVSHSKVVCFVLLVLAVFRYFAW